MSMSDPNIIVRPPSIKAVVGRIQPILAQALRARLFNPFVQPDWLDPRRPQRRRRPVCWSKSNAWENGLMLLLFNNTNFALVGDATGLRGSSTAGSLYFSLHTADPGEAGDQTTSAAAYTSYARVAVARSGAGFTVTANSVSPAATVGFPAATGGSETETYFGVGTSSSGAGVLLYSGTVTPNIAVASGVTPQLDTTSACTED